MIEIFLIGVGLGLALGATLMSLYRTSNELKEAQETEILIERKNKTIAWQKSKIDFLESKLKGGE